MFLDTDFCPEMGILGTLINRSNLWPQWPWDIQNGHPKCKNASNFMKIKTLSLILHRLSLNSYAKCIVMFGFEPIPSKEQGSGEGYQRA